MIDYDKEQRLAKLLADARPYSLIEFGERLDLSPQHVGKYLKRLAEKGLHVEGKEGEFIRLTRPLVFFDERLIREKLPRDVNVSLPSLEILWCTDSTNAQLMTRRQVNSGHVCLAEYQTAGRGRRQRPWRAPIGGGICMSYAVTFPKQARDVATTGLVAGVAVRDALEKSGARGLKLKWPNDLVWRNRKVGGLLCELRSDGGSAHSHTVIIGIGLNYWLDGGAREDISGLGGLEVADLQEAFAGAVPDRNDLVAAVLCGLTEAMRTFHSDGFAPFVNSWRAADAYRDEPVVVTTSSQSLDGIARGIDETGALQLDVNGTITSIVSAQISMRPA
ncbi:MAG: biotin--[acetyl-CoA-carboxylase] ligase [Gammaproteobacteria bacterium]|nr:biotin--[acetyl-CoA-carboxylase] ligase [Gammaproteobacteria bacterium]